MAVQILDVVEKRIFVVERAPGVLVWEMEDSLPFVSAIETHLDVFVSSLHQMGLVHGDIRPWNIFYDHEQQVFKVIDWGFSFFIGDNLDQKTSGHLSGRGHANTPLLQIDSIDAQRTLQVLRGAISYEDAWNHKPHETEWRPKWAKRQAAGPS
jgi:serine/threonine protein kinase